MMASPNASFGRTPSVLEETPLSEDMMAMLWEAMSVAVESMMSCEICCNLKARESTDHFPRCSYMGNVAGAPDQ